MFPFCHHPTTRSCNISILHFTALTIKAALFSPVSSSKYIRFLHKLGIVIRPCTFRSKPIIFRDGASCGGTQLPVSPLDENSEWHCDRCPVVLMSSEAYDLVSRIGEEVDNVQAVSTELEMKRFAVF
jgi:hypothetical protein